MITSFKQATDLAKKYNKIKTDKERLKFIKSNGDSFKVVLDNDESFVEFHFVDVDTDEEATLIFDIELNRFDEFHGNSEGVVLLFEFIGIHAEGC